MMLRQLSAAPVLTIQAAGKADITFLKNGIVGQMLVCLRRRKPFIDLAAVDKEISN
jgi:hypothetical protein